MVGVSKLVLRIGGAATHSLRCRALPGSVCGVVAVKVARDEKPVQLAGQVIRALRIICRQHFAGLAGQLRIGLMAWVTRRLDLRYRASIELARFGQRMDGWRRMFLLMG